MPKMPYTWKMQAIGLDHEDGYEGVFTRRQYDGAMYSNGTRVTKAWCDPSGDETTEGTVGTVLGSIGHPDLPGCMYFVEWDTKPKRVFACVESKLRPE